MDIVDLQLHWDAMGRADPLWFILARPGKQHGRWDLREFFATGEAEVKALMKHLDSVAPDRKKDLALDFGCGVGRLTEALALHYGEVRGVDIAPSMIEKAEQLAVRKNCSYILNTEPDLLLFADGIFDLVYSNIVLQHMEPRYMKAYVGEFARVLAPGGIAVFQIPYDSKSGAKSTVARSGAGFRPTMEMYCADPGEIETTVADGGLEVVARDESSDAGPVWMSYRYTVRKPFEESSDVAS